MANDPQKPAVSVTDTACHAESHGTAPAFNIVLGYEALRPLAYFAGAILAVVLLVSLTALGVSIWAITSSSAWQWSQGQRMEDKIDEANTNLRQGWYWESQVYAELLARGIKAPLPPTPKGLTHERSRRRDQ